jgi:2-hydroxycarboxylate transporter family
MYPIETAIVNACHSGQGGTGDVAILTAANRMQLMPFAQIATRIGRSNHGDRRSRGVEVDRLTSGAIATPAP